MEYSNQIDEIVKKFNYPYNIKKAIEITLPLMVKKYGRENDILEVFNNIPIISIKEVTKESYDKISKKMTDGINTHIISEEETSYGNDAVAGSAYLCEPVYDNDMNIIEERRCVAVEEISDTRKESFEQLFGTNINIPYFIHEMGHAVGMYYSTYKKEDNKIFFKRGLYETVSEIVQTEEGTKIVSCKQENLLLEEAVNEKLTQDMLVDYFKVDDYSKVTEKLYAAGYGGVSYSPTMISLAEHLEKAMGLENLLNWRIDNDTSIKDNFNKTCAETQIGKTYFKENEAIAYLSKKIHEIYLKSCEAYKYPAEVYKDMVLADIIEALSVTFAYNEGIGKKTFEDYASIRNEYIKEDSFENKDKTM